MIETVELYWDCECKNNYIHYHTETVCHVCLAHKDDQPNSHYVEVVKYLKANLDGLNQMIDTVGSFGTKDLLRRDTYEARWEELEEYAEEHDLDPPDDLPEYFAEVKWTVEDVLGCAEYLGITMSRTKAYAFLERNEKKLRDLLCERGNEAIMAHLEWEEHDDG